MTVGEEYYGPDVAAFEFFIRRGCDGTGINIPGMRHHDREDRFLDRGRIGLVHYLVANPPAGGAFIKCFGLSTGFGYPMRAVTIYERGQQDLPLGAGA